MDDVLSRFRRQFAGTDERSGPLAVGGVRRGTSCSSDAGFRLPLVDGCFRIGGVIRFRRAPSSLSASGFGGAWFALCVAFALHIVDEASTGFLSGYNPTVIILRERWSWVPMPTFQFRDWLVMLWLGCGLLFCPTSMACRRLH